MLVSLSPLKPSKYFDAELTDGNQCIRIVGFDKSQQAKLQPFYDKGLPVKLQNCQVKKKIDLINWKSLSETQHRLDYPPPNTTLKI